MKLFISVIVGVFLLMNCQPSIINTLPQKKYAEIELIDSTGLYRANKNDKWGLLTSDGKELTEFKYSNIGFFYNDFASIDIIDSEGYNLFNGYIDRNGKEFLYPYMSYESLNWNISNPPSEIPDYSEVLGQHSYLNFSWTLPSILNHNLKAFVDEPQSYSDLNNLDKVCIGYGMLIAGGNYSEDYIFQDKTKWKLFKENTIFPILKNEKLRGLAWEWIKPYYKDAYQKSNPFVKKVYQECFKYLNDHINSFDQEKYTVFLQTNEQNFSKLDINRKVDSKRKLSAYVDRLILVHNVISHEDAKRWINLIYDEVKQWK